jgi:hypothetical protein
LTASGHAASFQKLIQANLWYLSFRFFQSVIGWEFPRFVIHGDYVEKYSVVGRGSELPCGLFANKAYSV